ncbi:DUF6544 family protein [Rheinheimera pleomorphica]|uniref:DUF6544 family protein n=1 Tax=Rheinheimera pleomorphica TaxID=2703963 RepID=UPI00142207D9|nr:DUF6544 family protein [Rheinheimera pleomorphica]
MWLMLISVILLLCISMACWRWLDYCADRRLVRQLHQQQARQPACFNLQLLDGLPEPARRFFTFAIKPGTPLYTVADITMTGQFGMGDADNPNYLPMRARQTLAFPAGFVWQMQTGRKWLRISGSDSQHWTRFWLQGLLPVARLGGDANHSRAAFGRYVAEAVFWTPAAVLPGPGIQWTAVSEHCARLTVTYAGMTQQVDVTLAENGQPRHVSFMRWSNANPERRYQLQPFGGYLSAFRDFNGYCLPSHVEAGNQFASAAYFAFFIADIQGIKWPGN